MSSRPQALRSLAFGVCIASFCLTPSASARRWPAQEEPAMPRVTEEHPRNYSRPPGAAGPVLSECESPRILIGNLKMPRERGGIFGKDSRPVASFDGMPVETPGFFRMMRAEDGIGTSRGPGGILGLKDPMILRGHLITRKYKEARPAWVTPGLMTERLFTAGAMKRVPFVRLLMKPREFLKHLRGEEAHLTLELQNPTRYDIPDITVRLFAETKASSFPMERRIALEEGWEYERVFKVDLGSLDRQKFRVHLPGKTDPRVYREIEAATVGGKRWPYPGLRVNDPTRQTMLDAGDDFERLLPHRTLLITAGDIQGCGAAPYPVIVRHERMFRSFGTLLDGLDLEIMAAWNKADTLQFQKLVRQNASEFPEALPGLIAAALKAKSRRVPVQRRPGGYDEFDAMAMYMYGSIADPSEGYTGFDDSDDAPLKPADHLYRHEGTRLPPTQREELRSRVKSIFARRSLRGLGPAASKGGPHDYPGEDDRLPESVRKSIYEPVNDWVTTERRIRSNREIRNRRNRSRYWSADSKYKNPSKVKSPGRARTAAKPKPPARPKPTVRPRPKPPETSPMLPPEEEAKPIRPVSGSLIEAQPKPMEEEPITEDSMGDFEDDFGGFE